VFQEFLVHQTSAVVAVVIAPVIVIPVGAGYTPAAAALVNVAAEAKSIVAAKVHRLIRILWETKGSLNHLYIQSYDCSGT